MLTMAVFGATISYALMTLSHIVLRRLEPDLERPCRTPGGSLTSGRRRVRAVHRRLRLDLPGQPGGGHLERSLLPDCGRLFLPVQPPSSGGQRARRGVRGRCPGRAGTRLRRGASGGLPPEQFTIVCSRVGRMSRRRNPTARISQTSSNRCRSYGSAGAIMKFCAPCCQMSRTPIRQNCPHGTCPLKPCPSPSD